MKLGLFTLASGVEFLHYRNDLWDRYWMIASRMCKNSNKARFTIAVHKDLIIVAYPSLINEYSVNIKVVDK